MIFRPELARLVAAGKKTQTRRVAHEHHDPPTGRHPPRPHDLAGVPYQ